MSLLRVNTAAMESHRKCADTTFSIYKCVDEAATKHYVSPQLVMEQLVKMYPQYTAAKALGDQYKGGDRGKTNKKATS